MTDNDTSRKIRQRILDCNRFDRSAYRPLIIGDHIVGAVTNDIAARLKSHADVFAVRDHEILMQPGLQTPESRSQVMAKMLAAWRKDGLIPGWRDELYPVTNHFTAPPLLAMERAAVPFFGFCGFGVHINGFVVRPDGIHMWVGKRSINKPTGPGKLDQMVAGGQPLGMTLWDNMIKECGEEASIPEPIARQAKPVGAISYSGTRPEGLRNDVLYIYDLMLADDFTPVNGDGEVETFYLWPIKKVLDIVLNTDHFKFNTALVVIDFCIRHGIINADLPDYSSIIQGLHTPPLATQFYSKDNT